MSETKSETAGTNDDEHPCQEKGLRLREGDEILVNDRVRRLTVVGRHKRQNASSCWRSQGLAKYHTVIELEGNRTEYHLLCTGGSETGPMLYKESEWDDDKTNKMGLRPRYTEFGERVKEMEIIKSLGGTQ